MVWLINLTIINEIFFCIIINYYKRLMSFTSFKIWLMEPKTPQPHLKPFTTLESINSTLVVRADIVENLKWLEL